MPQLPTLTVTQAQADRMIAAFGSAAAYQSWLRSQIVTKVLSAELAVFDTAYIQQRDAKRAEIEAALPPV